MGNDQDRLQQLEDNVNAGDSVYQALGVQQNTMRKIAKSQQREDAIQYYLDEGFALGLAEEYADAELNLREED